MVKTKVFPYLISGIGLVDFGFPRQIDVTGLIASLIVKLAFGTLPRTGRVIVGVSDRLDKTSGA